MSTKKQRLVELHGDWTAGEISCSYKTGLKFSTPITNPADAYLLISSLWDKNLIGLQEQFLVVYLNTKQQVIGYRILNTGNLTACHVDVRLLVSLALHCMACAVIIAHNHPSGSLSPSNSDVSLTDKIKQALALIEVKLNDHLILSAGEWLSMKAEGWI